MPERMLALEMSDFARDHCLKCEYSLDYCTVSSAHKKCLRTGFIVSTFKGVLYTVRRDYPIDDYRHYVFERQRTLDAVHSDLRKNA